MSYLDIEKQLNEITDNLRQNLEKAGAINKEGDTIDRAKFEKVIDDMISKIIPIRRQLELERYDANSANIVESRMEWLRTIKNAHSIRYPEHISDEREEKILKAPQKDYGRLTEVFKDGAKLVTRLFGFQRGKPQQPEHGK
ncbi:MAG: hypothetical protein J6Y07_01535 [Alphaproteobacteria bacterium]|nr:hypothetical protein [Alphaproteobacteria bacterium]